MEISPTDPPTEAADSPSREEIEAFVGKNARYYIGQWTPSPRTGRRRLGFNVGALLLSGLWIGYRKMYLVAAIFFGIVCAESLLEEIVFVEIQGLPEVPMLVSKLVGVCFAVVAGIFGNRWYLAHAKREIAKVRTSGVTGEELTAALAKRGGTSVLASIATLAIGMAVFLVAYIGLELALHSTDFGTQLKFYSNDDVYILEGVEESDAGVLAEFLEAEEFFGGEGISVQLARGPQGFTVSFALVHGAWNDAEFVALYEDLGTRLADQHLGRPLTIEMCDTYFEPRKTLVIE